jgi:hypothetical protein
VASEAGIRRGKMVEAEGDAIIRRRGVLGAAGEGEGLARCAAPR